MIQNKLTPCRKVGLSRKKNAPLKTVESLLTKTTSNEIPKTPEISTKSKDLKSNLKIIVNNDTPCRQVGLSRKKTTPNLLGSIKKKEKLITPTDKPTKKNNSVVNITEGETGVELLTTMSGKKENISNNASRNSKLKDDVHVRCAKKLSSLFSANSEHVIEETRLKIKESTSLSEEQVEEIFEVDECSLINENPKLIGGNEVSVEISDISKNKEQNIEKPIRNEEQDYPGVNTLENIDLAVTSKNSSQTIDVTQNQSHFVKVCYSNDTINQSEVHVKSKGTKKKFSSKVFEDDDDFEIAPEKKKARKFGRSKTENVDRERKNHNIKLKKSLSLGDSKSRSFIGHSISTASSSDFTKVCFVELEKLKEPTSKIDMNLLSQEHSDDDFEFSCKPKENKIQKLDILEKKVNEKRKILEDLQRAKVYKKMHSLEELKELTHKWKIGCVDALQDLLKQLNMHSYMNMEMLLKKLNIPQDFVPLSQ